MRRNDEVLFLDLVDCTHQVKVVSLVGKRFPLHSTAPGKVFLAFDPGAPPASTPFGRELATIRTAGVSIDHQGMVEGTTCIAAPLFTGNTELAGVLAMLAPDYRMGRERIDGTLIPALKAAAGVISSRLGYLGHLLPSGTLGTP
jgi:DNA-binding IclR family transcriptional regulator